MPVAPSQDRSDPVQARNSRTCLARRDHCCDKQRAPWCDGCRVRSLSPCATSSEADGRMAPAFWVSESIVPAGDDIVEQSEPCGDFYVIVDGWAAQYELLEDGSRQILDFLPAGSIAGFQPDGDAPLAYFVQALTTVRICSFSTAGFLRAAQSNSALALWLAAAASRSHCRSLHRLTLIGRMTARNRVAALLLELYRQGRPWSASDREDEISLPMTQEHIGDALGLTSIHVNRMLRELREEGLLVLRHGVLRILDRERLAEMAGWDDHRPESHPTSRRVGG